MNAEHPQPELSATVPATFLFTDVEGSTQLVQRWAAEFVSLLEEHRRLIREASARYGGLEQTAEGDAFFIVFPSAAAGVGAAVAMQQAMAGHTWPHHGRVQVRIGLHTGEATVVGGRYYGIDVHRAARVCNAAHGGQILLSSASAQGVAHELPSGVGLRNVGTHRLKDLARPERLFQAEIEGLRSAFPAPRTASAAPVNLPFQRTSFVGRVEERREGGALLARTRLLTLTGSGGTGKTRLAMELARDAAGDFPDGICFVALSPVDDPELVCASVAHALGLADNGRAPILDVLVDYLADKQVLLVLDNFERLLPAARVVGDLLDRTPTVKVLVTSRAPLRVSGEQQLEVRPLSLETRAAPDDSTTVASEAARLFVARAREVMPSLDLDRRSSDAIEEVCGRLDGLPLAIELAAARVRVLPPVVMLQRLQQPLSLLTAGPRERPARQQSLRNTIAWSYDLLDEPARTVFACFSVFGGGAALTTLDEVCPPGCAVLDGVTQLVEHSLVHPVEGNGRHRFTMLATISDFAAERLAHMPDAVGVRQRHAESFLGLAETTASRILLGHGRDWIDRLEQEHHNLRAALSWFCGQHQVDHAVRMSAALWRFWQMRGHLTEGRERIETVLALAEQATDPTLHLAALDAAGGIAYWQGDVSSAERFYRACLDLSRRIGDRAWSARSLSSLAYTLRGLAGSSGTSSSATLALRTAKEALAQFRDLGDDAGEAGALRLIAVLQAGQGNLGVARAGANAALQIFARLNRPFDLAWTLRQVGVIEMRSGRLPEASRSLRDSLRLLAGLQDVSSMPVLLGDLAALAVAQGDPERAEHLSDAAAAMQASSGARWASVVRSLDRQQAPRPSEEIPQESEWVGGAEFAIEDVVEYALG